MMRRFWMLVAVIGLALLVGGCGSGSNGSSDEAESGPATVTELKDGLNRVELTASAAKRLDIHTAAVAKGAGATVVPYSAVLYSPTGETWVYVSSKPLTFVRQRIVVGRIDGERALLRSGPALGTQVATVGVAELFGAESGLGQ